MFSRSPLRLPGRLRTRTSPTRSRYVEYVSGSTCLPGSGRVRSHGSDRVPVRLRTRHLFVNVVCGPSRTFGEGFFVVTLAPGGRHLLPRSSGTLSSSWGPFYLPPDPPTPSLPRTRVSIRSTTTRGPFPGEEAVPRPGLPDGTRGKRDPRWTPILLSPTSHGSPTGALCLVDLGVKTGSVPVS